MCVKFCEQLKKLLYKIVCIIMKLKLAALSQVGFYNFQKELNKVKSPIMFFVS